MTINEVSKLYDLSADTLRYYEKIGLIPPVNRTSGGIRNYTDGDCKWVQFIKCMRNVGIPIEVLTEYVDLFKQNFDTSKQRKEILITQRKILNEKIKIQKAVLKRLDYKIYRYEEESELEEDLRKYY